MITTAATIRASLPKLMNHIVYDPNNFLRDTPRERAPFLYAIRVAKQWLQVVQQKHQQDVESLCLLYGFLGDIYRILNDQHRALYYLKKTLTLTNDPSSQIASLIRLGDTFKYLADYTQALACYDHAEQLIKQAGLGKFYDFLFQHRGKCYLELGRNNDALACFEQALRLRKQQNNASLIASTELAIAFAKKQLDNGKSESVTMV